MLLRVTPGRMIPLSRGGVTSSLEILKISLISFYGKFNRKNSLPAVAVIEEDE